MNKYLQTLQNIKDLAKLGLTVTIDNCHIEISGKPSNDRKAQMVGKTLANCIRENPVLMTRQIKFAKMCKNNRITPIEEYDLGNLGSAFLLPNRSIIDDTWRTLEQDYPGICYDGLKRIPNASNEAKARLLKNIIDSYEAGEGNVDDDYEF